MCLGNVAVDWTGARVLDWKWHREQMWVYGSCCLIFSADITSIPVMPLRMHPLSSAPCRAQGILAIIDGMCLVLLRRPARPIVRIL